jgi:16S rRNA G966 N2-methylase RsmD
MSTNNKKKIFVEKIFPYLHNKFLSKNLQIDDETMTFITLPYDTKIIKNIMHNHINKYNKLLNKCTIIDANGGAGGDTIAFAKYFKSVISIEIDQERCNFIENNINVYQLKNVLVLNGNSNSIIKKIPNVDIIYFDPPWGGKNYKNIKNIKIQMDNISIETIIKDIFDSSKMLSTPNIVVIKLPKNYDIKYFYETINFKPNFNSNIINAFNITLYSLKKMYIVVIENNYNFY